MPRLVTHIDDGAIAAVGAAYEELGVGWTDVSASVVVEPGPGGDPLYAVWATAR